MTIEEFSNGFDTLVSAYQHSAQFGEQSSIFDASFDEYEKSLFLTQAQEELVKQHFEKYQHPQQVGFDDSTTKQMGYSTLIYTDRIDTTVLGNDQYNDNSTLFDLSDLEHDFLFIINEKVQCGDTWYTVVPIHYKEYDRMMSKAYNQPLKRQAWRILHGNTYSEIITRQDAAPISQYRVRYIKKPDPIILINLSSSPNQPTINGKSEISECELHPILHNDILTLAVQLALASRGIQTREAQAAAKAQNKDE